MVYQLIFLMSADENERGYIFYSRLLTMEKRCMCLKIPVSSCSECKKGEPMTLMSIAPAAVQTSKAIGSGFFSRQNKVVIRFLWKMGVGCLRQKCARVMSNDCTTASGTTASLALSALHWHISVSFCLSTHKKNKSQNYG